jgi:hypothetical protein
MGSDNFFWLLNGNETHLGLFFPTMSKRCVCFFTFSITKRSAFTYWIKFASEHGQRNNAKEKRKKEKRQKAKVHVHVLMCSQSSELQYHQEERCARAQITIGFAYIIALLVFFFDNAMKPKLKCVHTAYCITFEMMILRNALTSLDKRIKRAEFVYCGK